MKTPKDFWANVVSAIITLFVLSVIVGSLAWLVYRAIDIEMDNRTTAAQEYRSEYWEGK